TTICTTIAPYGSLSSPQSSLPITQALQNCSAEGGGVVLLGTGTFSLSDSIGWSMSNFAYSNSVQNVMLRGAGPDQTTLRFSGSGNGGSAFCTQGTGFICVSSAIDATGQCGNIYNPNTTNWTANYTQGTSQIALDSIAGNGTTGNPLTVGMYLI